MKRIDLNQDWTLSRPGGIFDSFGVGPGGRTVHLPHDAMIEEDRRPGSANGPDGAWYDGGTYIYEKHLAVPADWAGRPIWLELEGVASNGAVFVDGQYAGKAPYTYTNTKLPISQLLNYGGESVIKIVAKTRMQQTSRWYVGSGVIRPVWLWVGSGACILPDGLRFTTDRLSGQEAAVTVTAEVTHTDLTRRTCRLQIEVKNPAGAVVAREDQPLTLFGQEHTTVTARFLIENPKKWNVDTPDLYTVTAILREESGELDRAEIRSGIRTVTVDQRHGLQINGETVKLRGGAVHHDNGILGGITLKDAELRRVRKMKEAGFNAIRSAHNPASRYLVEACDEVGMFLMDELFDVWNESKRDHDYSLYFQEWWQKDMESLVAKDYNHPSVILYTMGNEIPETGTPAGAAQNRRMANYFRALDPTRPIANCINGMFSVMPHMRTILAEVLGKEISELPTDINALMSMFDANVDEIMLSDIVADATEETFAGVDVCGYNYMASRYVLDGTKYPNRVIVGSETCPDKIGYNWPVVMAQDHVIGDFCWTGWDYIGEAGVGKNDYDLTHSMYGPWPWYVAYCGDHDLIGDRRPQSYYREIVFGLRTAPYLAVERPEHFGQPKWTTNWTWPDVIESWTWPGFEGKPTHVEVYSSSEEVELLVNGRSLGRKAVGEEMPCKAVFDVVYEPGELRAVSYRGGLETGRTALETTGPATEIGLVPSRAAAPADGHGLIYLEIELRDSQGILARATDVPVTLDISGNAALLGYGSADPKSMERFDSHTHRTYDGRALAVLSSGIAGRVIITASTEGFRPGRCVIEFA